MSVCSFTHVVPHSASPAGHAHAPVVVLHVSPPVHAAHAAPPAPQLAVVSLARASHTVGLLQQPVHPVVVLHAHTPAVHVVPAPHA